MADVLLGPASGFVRARLINPNPNQGTVQFDLNPKTLTVTKQGGGGGGAGGGASRSGLSSASPFASGGAPSSSGSGGSHKTQSSQTKDQPGAGTHKGSQSGATAPVNNTLGSVECYIDGNFTDSVHTRAALLRSWVGPVPRPGTNTSTNPNPPYDNIQFWVGSTKWICGKLSSVVTAYDLFLPNGHPCRAKVTFSMVEVAPEDRKWTPTGVKQNPTSGGLSSYSSTTMAMGDTLQSVAYREYGRANLWRKLAEVNNVDDPLRVSPGTMILLPSLTELLAGPG